MQVNAPELSHRLLLVADSQRFHGVSFPNLFPNGLLWASVADDFLRMGLVRSERDRGVHGERDLAVGID